MIGVAMPSEPTATMRLAGSEPGSTAGCAFGAPSRKS